MTIAERRVSNQHIATRGLRRPQDVVTWFGAMQAQEYEPAKWAIGLRLVDGTTSAKVQRACDEGRILRTHVMRPTWHFVAAADIRWLLELTAPRVHRILSYYNRALELDARTLTRGTAVIEQALGAGRHLTRVELAESLSRARLPMSGNRLARVVMHAELEGVICSGRRRERQSTYALVAERAPNAERLSHDEALATLGQRFFRSHGPATIRDFAWWSGLTIADGKRATEMIRAQREMIDGLAYWSVGPSARRTARDERVHLLPIYDEYLVAYRDRQAVPHRPAHPWLVVERIGDVPACAGGRRTRCWDVAHHEIGNRRGDSRGAAAAPRFNGAPRADCCSSKVRAVRRAACHVLGRALIDY